MTGEVTASGAGAVAAGGNIINSLVITGGEHHHHAPPPSSPAPPHHLPGDLPEFTGRQSELSLLLGALDQDNGGMAAVTTLRGMGGVGKTALAQHAARRLKDRYPDGQIIVDLNGHGKGEPTTPVDAILRVIRAFRPDQPPLGSATQALGLYRSILADKRVLILLDNAADADQVRDLVPPPPCGALITARSLVKPPGCTEIPLGLLPLPESIALLRRLAETQMADAKVWEALAECCGRLPLALHVAGSTLASAEDLTVADYLNELADEAKRPHRLALPDDTTANVAAVLSYSARRLIATAPELAVHWQELCVFPASFNRMAAAAVWKLSEADAAPILRGLLQRSLLLFEKDQNRYRLHDLMRPLARKIFDHAPASDPPPGSGERVTMAEVRFAEHFRGVLREAKELYKQGHDKAIAGLSLYDIEAKNIAVAAEWAIANAETNPTAQFLAAWLPNTGVHILALRLHPRQRVAWLKAAVCAATAIGDQELAISLLGNLGIAYASLNQTQQAIDIYKQVLSISRKCHDKKTEGNQLGNLGLAYADLEQIDMAISFYKQALNIQKNISDEVGVTKQLGNLGNAYVISGKPKRAIRCFEDALAIARKRGDMETEGGLLSCLGNAYTDLNSPPRAIKSYNQAISIFRKIKNNLGEANALSNLGGCYFNLEDSASAIKFTEQALELYLAIDSPKDVNNMHHNLSIFQRSAKKT